MRPFNFKARELARRNDSFAEINADVRRRLAQTHHPHMKTKSLISYSAALCIAVLPVAALAQTSKDNQVEKKALQVEKQKLEVEKQKLEVQKQQLEEMRKELRVQETPTVLTMHLQGDVLFDFEKADLRTEAQKALDKVAVVLAQFPSAKVQIDGHTDAKGKPALNLELSEKRAVAVQEYLKKRAELAGINFTTRGLGETKPIAPNDTEEGRQKNRRVELTVTK